VAVAQEILLSCVFFRSFGLTGPLCRTERTSFVIRDTSNEIGDTTFQPQVNTDERGQTLVKQSLMGGNRPTPDCHARLIEVNWPSSATVTSIPEGESEKKGPPPTP
jgi:hypothetical protein